jgi:hypothetical protein
MSVQDSPKQADIQILANQVAVAASTPLARFVPSASVVPDRHVDEWVERGQRRDRRSIKIGLTILAVTSLTAIALATF